MKSTTLFFTTLILAALLAACAGQGVATNQPETSVPSFTVVPTSTSVIDTPTMAATEAPTLVPDMTHTPSVPVTGELGPARVSNLIGSQVCDLAGQSLGTMQDMVVDFDQARVTYGLVNTNGRTAGVPWTSFDATGFNRVGSATAKNDCLTFIGDAATLSGAPAFERSTVPSLGVPAAAWYSTLDDYWQNSGAGGNAETTGTAVPTTSSSASAGTQSLQGVMLAGDLLGTTIQVQNNGTTAGTTDLTVDDVIVAPNTGEIQYFVVNGAFANGNRLIPVPLSMLRWNGSDQAFSLGVNTTGLENAPALENGQYPNFSVTDEVTQWYESLGNYWGSINSDVLIETPTQ